MSNNETISCWSELAALCKAVCPSRGEVRRMISGGRDGREGGEGGTEGREGREGREEGKGGRGGREGGMIDKYGFLDRDTKCND